METSEYKIGSHMAPCLGCSKHTSHGSGRCAQCRTVSCLWTGCEQRFASRHGKKYCAAHARAMRVRSAIWGAA